MGMYHNLCIQLDVLLIVDIFEKFRDICLDICKLEPAQVFTVPGLVSCAALTTSVRLELLTDIDILLMFQCIRGGITQEIHRYAVANKHMRDQYNLNKLISF